MNILLLTSSVTTEQHQQFCNTLALQLGKTLLTTDTPPGDIEEYTQAHDVDLLCISCHNRRKTLQQHLQACRSLRIPYLFLTDTMQLTASLHRMLLPVTLLQEEVHKAETAAHLARFTGAGTVLLQAKDYGSKARQNTQRIGTLLEKFNLPYTIEDGRKDSFHLLREATDRQRELGYDLLLLTASRDYGLDDIVFGPPERHALQHSLVPVMLLNPRGDLYSLCD